jgi:hypothetical protein
MLNTQCGSSMRACVHASHRRVGLPTRMSSCGAGVFGAWPSQQVPSSLTHTCVASYLPLCVLYAARCPLLNLWANLHLLPFEQPFDDAPMSSLAQA